MSLRIDNCDAVIFILILGILKSILYQYLAMRKRYLNL